MISVSDSYGPRHIRFYDLWTIGEWRLKVYAISPEPGDLSPVLVRSAQNIAEHHLPLPAAANDRYGVGFVGIHAGRGSNVVFVDWWGNENELHHHVVQSHPETPDDLRPATESAFAACVWDIAVLCFERAAWITAVLDAPEPSLERYLEMRFSAFV